MNEGDLRGLMRHVAQTYEQHEGGRGSVIWQSEGVRYVGREEAIDFLTTL